MKNKKTVLENECENSFTVVSGAPLNTTTIYNVARSYYSIFLSKNPETQNRILKSHDAYAKMRLERIIYGDTTGYGERVNQIVPAECAPEKQMKLVAALMAGAGDNLREDLVRAAIMTRIVMLTHGNSSIRPVIIETLCNILNTRTTPEVPSIGSLNNSGDLVPSSYYAADVLKYVGKFEGREGLALVNGTQFSTGISALAVEDLNYLFKINFQLFALLIQLFEGIKEVFDKELHELKNHREQSEIASFMQNLLNGSSLLKSIEAITTVPPEQLKEMDPIQDKYLIRCLPQQLGSILHALRYTQKVVIDELIGVADNPVVVDGKLYQGGQFDGSYIADSLISLKGAARRLGYIMRAYMQMLMDPKLNGGILPAYLICKDPGVNNGFQGIGGLTFHSLYIYLAREAMPFTNFAGNDHENHNQDIVSLGMHEALSATQMIDYLRSMTAILALATRQAIELRNYEDTNDFENKLSPQTKQFYDTLKELIPFNDEDKLYFIHDTQRTLETMLFDHSLLEQ
jgi:phenylalanine ammonia-lyase